MFLVTSFYKIYLSYNKKIFFYPIPEKQTLTKKRNMLTKSDNTTSPQAPRVHFSHPGIRQSAASVERWQQSKAQVFGHVQELILVPLHVLTSLF